MRTGEAIPGVTLDTAPKGQLQKALSTALREAILSGKLKRGDQLPSTRDASSYYGISRTTFRIVYDQLCQEGYLVGKRGSGTIVAAELPDQFEIAKPVRTSASGKTKKPVELSRRGELLRNTPVTAPRTFLELRPFRAWLPSFRDFPLETWGRLSRRKWAGATERSLKYGGPQGLRLLREGIRQHIARERGISCNVEQILVVAGSQEALFLSALVLADPGDAVAVEDPGYIGARGAFTAAGLVCTPVGVDEEGLEPNGLSGISNCRLAFLTPSHQYPLGVTMSLSRRVELLAWAAENSSFLLEDDYDSDFRYGPRAISALKALDRNDRVIYIGSFSKVLIPSIRLGYLVVPEPLVDSFLRARALIDRGSPSIEQATLAAFIEEGHFDSHIRKMRRLYAERQDVLLRAVTQHCGEHIDVKPSTIGMHLVGQLPRNIAAERLAKIGEQRGIELTPLSNFALRKTCPNGVMLGYTALSHQAIRDGARRLGECLKAARSS